MVVVPPDALEIALAGLEGQGVYDAMSAHASGINESNESDDDVNWVVNTLSDKIAGTSSETFDSLVTNLQKEKRDISSLRNMQASASMSIAADIQQYAEQIA